MSNKMWARVKLSDIGSVVGGATPSTSVEKYYGGEIAWVTPKDLSSFSGRYIECGERNITEEGLNSCSAQLLPAGSVLFSSRAPIGYVAIAKNPIATNQGFKSLVPDTKKVDSLFMYYLLKYNKNRIEAMGSGTTFKEVSGATMKNIEVNLPPLAEQKRIAAILGALDDKIELNRRINANLEEQAQALFRSWFVDFEPFRDGSFVDSELGKIPQGWKVGDIYTYTDVIYGAPYKSALFNTDKKGYPLIRIRDLKTYSPQFYTEEILPNTEYVEFGDIVAGMDAEFVPSIWKGEKGLLNQRVCKFIPKYDYVSKYYILSLIRPELEFVQSYKVGTTVSHLGKSDIDKFKVITPPAEIVKRFSCIVDSFHLQIIKLAKENLNLSALRDTLLPKLMSSELSVESDYEL
jgi:putative type-1 restriction enzyme mjaXP specificity protein